MLASNLRLVGTHTIRRQLNDGIAGQAARERYCMAQDNKPGVHRLRRMTCAR